MLSQTSAEALHSAAYVQHYLDCVENLPDDLQRHLTRMRELDVTYRACLRDLERHMSACMTTGDGTAVRRERALSRVRSSLITAQEIGDEKLQLVQVVQDLIDNKSRQLDQDYRTLLSCMEVSTNGASTEEAATPAAEPPPPRDKEPAPAPPAPAPARNASPPAPSQNEREKEKNDRDKTGERWSKRARRSRTATGGNAGAHTDGDSGERENTERGAHNNTTHKKGIGKKKKRKARATAAAQRAETPPEEADAIDPDEPRYCLCDQISFGEMILCDNDLCPIEWFHFSCVYLTTKPKGKWFCPKCRGDRPNVMKPKGQFLKELERYNKEKEEKA